MAKIGNVKLGTDCEQLISDLSPGTLIEWDKKHICLWAWAGLIELTGQLFWSKETVEQLKMRGVPLPNGTVVELIQQ